MFQESCARNRNAIYAIIGSTPIQSTSIDGGINYNAGTGFTIAPGIIVTAAHIIHNAAVPEHSTHSTFAAIRAPDIGQSFESITLISEDLQRDVALFRITNPRSAEYLNLESTRVPIGTLCGSQGFPFAHFEPNQQGQSIFIATERFQGSHISSYISIGDPTGRSMNFYETDSLMYPGSSGCPVFLANSKVVGMQVRSLMENNPSNPAAGGIRGRFRV